LIPFPEIPGTAGSAQPENYKKELPINQNFDRLFPGLMTLPAHLFFKPKPDHP
jgi:hypothetical protein